MHSLYIFFYLAPTNLDISFKLFSSSPTQTLPSENVGYKLLFLYFIPGTTVIVIQCDQNCLHVFNLKIFNIFSFAVLI